jgi:uncharacterized protein YecE (DUF72 family)
VALLRSFLEIVPPGMKAAFEFRHASWFNDEVFSALRATNCAFAAGDSEKIHPPIIVTAKHAYFRLRDEGYQSADLERWAGEVQKAAATANDIYVYFKHEESGLGPEFAAALQKLLRR